MNPESQHALGILYIHGKSASKIADGCEKEIRYVVGTKMVDQKERDLNAPPTRAYEHAFRRQINKLLADWQSDSLSHSDKPTNVWVRRQLGIWEDDGPDCKVIPLPAELVVEPYRQALIECIVSESERASSWALILQQQVLQGVARYII